MERVCHGKYPDLALAMFEKGTPWRRGYVKVETLVSSTGLSVSTTPTVDATGGNSRSLRRVTIVVEPTGTSASASTYTAKAVTYMTLGGP